MQDVLSATGVYSLFITLISLFLTAETMGTFSEGKSYSFSSNDIGSAVSIEAILGQVKTEVFDELRKSTVCIRQEAVIEGGMRALFPFFESQHTALMPFVPPMHKGFLVERGHGTGTVIGTERVDGRDEYLVLTNNHVAWRPYFESRVDEHGVLNYRMRAVSESDLSIVSDRYDDRRGATRLEIVARDVDSDAALLRTVNAPKLNILPYRLGVDNPGSIVPGATIYTAGFPLAENHIFSPGALLSVDAVDTHLTQYPNTHFLATLPTDPGQSGSPVLMPLITTDQGRIVVTPALIGLIYAGSKEFDTIHMITPYANFSHVVERKETRPSKRPSLIASVNAARMTEIYEGIAEMGHVIAIGKIHSVVKRVGDVYCLTQHLLSGPIPLTNQRLDITFRTDDSIHCDKITFHEHRTSPRRLNATDDLMYARRWDEFLTAVFNHAAIGAQFNTLSASSNDSRENKQLQYLARVATENLGVLRHVQESLHDGLYERRIINRHFLGNAQS